MVFVIHKKKVCRKVSRRKNLQWESCFSIHEEVFHQISLRLDYYY